MATLTLRGLRKSFGPLEIIKGIDLGIADRAFVVFVGPSGCGKSTLLHVETEHDGPLTIQTDGTTLVKPQQPIRLAVDAPACHVFDAAGEALPALVRHRFTRV